MTVVFVHGMFSGPACWDRVAARLRDLGIASERARLHPAGLPKAGRDLAAVTETVRDQVSGLADQPVLFVGHSVGALVVQRLLPAFPRASAVLVNPSPRWGTLGPFFPLWIAARRGRFWTGTIRLRPAESRALLFQGLTGPEAEAAHAGLEEESGELVRQAFWFFDLLGAATRMPGPLSRDVSVVTGALDPMATPAACRGLVPPDPSGSRLAVIAGAGHMSILQEAGAEVLTRRLLAVLDRSSHEVG